VKNVVHEHPIDSSNLEDVNRVLLANRPSQTTIQYICMKTYGNQFRVEDSMSTLSSTYDSGIALIFDMPTIDTSDVYVNYVGVLKDIFKLDMVQCTRLWFF